jgi:hypothetical protein
MARRTKSESPRPIGDRRTRPLRVRLVEAESLVERLKTQDEIRVMKQKLRDMRRRK